MYVWRRSMVGDWRSSRQAHVEARRMRPDQLRGRSSEEQQLASDQTTRQVVLLPDEDAPPCELESVIHVQTM